MELFDWTAKLSTMVRVALGTVMRKRELRGLKRQQHDPTSYDEHIAKLKTGKRMPAFSLQVVAR